MASKILQQKRINNNPVWCLCGTDFISKGVQFTIVGSESTGPGIYEVQHTIKNVATGIYAKILMPKLIEILLNCHDS